MCSEDVSEDISRALWGSLEPSGALRDMFESGSDPVLQKHRNSFGNIVISESGMDRVPIAFSKVVKFLV